MENSLWKYNTHSNSLDFLLSLHLTDGLNLPSEKQLSFLYALSNHAQNHYSQVFISKKNGLKDHLAHIGYKKGEAHYLQSLNSKINYVLYVNPLDSEFLLLKKELPFSSNIK